MSLSASKQYFTMSWDDSDGTFISDIAIDKIDKFAGICSALDERKGGIPSKQDVCRCVTEILNVIESVELDYAGNYYTVAKHGLRVLNALAAKHPNRGSFGVCETMVNTVAGRMRMHSLDKQKLATQEFGCMFIRQIYHFPSVQDNGTLQNELYRCIMDAFRFGDLSLQARYAGTKTIEFVPEHLRIPRGAYSTPDVITAYEKMCHIDYYRTH
jgi:hypothetical protein